jgi:protein TonB
LNGAPASVVVRIVLRYGYINKTEPNVELSQQIEQDITPSKMGANVTPPKAIHMVKPAKYTKEERKAKPKGSVLVNLWIDEQGKPIHVHVLKGTGTSLDQKAVDAVAQYLFSPAMEDGRPIVVQLNVEVIFKVF